MSRANARAMMRRQRGFAKAPAAGPLDSVGLRLGLWALLATAAGAGAAYALKKRHDISIFERKFDPDAELQASRIAPVNQRPAPDA